jgi:PAS domain S-box-containing protein
LRARESKQQEQNEVRTPDDRYFHLRGYPVLNEDNEVTGLIEFGQETTDRRRAEEALKESEHRFRSFVENASDIIYSLTPDGVFSYVSPNWKEFFGEPADAVIGKKFDPYIHPDDVQVCQEFLHSVLTGDRGSRTSLEYRVLRADGSVRWHTSTASALFDENGNAVSFVGIARDITEKKRMDQALKESEERFEMAMRGSSDGFWDWPDVTDTSYVWWSPRLFELIGYEPGEIRPSFSFWLESIHPDDQELASKAVQESLSRNAPFDVQYRLRTKSGSYRWFRARGVVLRDDDGQPRRMSGSLVDITETKRLQELESRAQRLETAGSIAGQVAHDFNNLLAPLTAYPDIIKEYLTVDHPAYTYLEDMERAAVQIGEINQQLLTLGRRGHYQQEPLVVNEVVEQILRQMEPLPPTLRVESRLADDLMYIKAGRSQIYRALTNLVNNAREAMQDIGCLSITTENCYVDEQLVNEGSVPRGEYVKLTVSDTGCGIPAKIRSRIFDPFFTTKQADKKRGSGLGISVVDAVVKDHQGFIDLHSVEGEGTSFYLYIPITRETPIGDGSHEVTGGTESILVVDDDEVQREVTRELLTRLGYRVDVAENGEQALQRLAAQSADLLLLDMIMPPGMDGAETYRKALEHAPDQRALLVSGFAESDRVELALNLGASAFVRKPLSRKTLAQAVRKALDTKSA